MVYRKTDNVLAKLARKRDHIVHTATRMADRNGLDALNVNEVAASAGVAVGTLYMHFPDRAELLAAVVARRLEHDLEFMSAAANAANSPRSALAAAIAVYVHRFSQMRRLGPSLADHPSYRGGIVREFTRRIAAAVTTSSPEPALRATAAYGALTTVLVSRPQLDAKNELALIILAMRAVGFHDLDAREAVINARPAIASGLAAAVA